LSRLLLVRHGITEFNSARRFAGHSDIELSDMGYRQVERLRDRLADEQIDAVYSSDLKRALVTAQVVSSGHNLDIVTCPELRELNYGEAEGLTFDEIGELYPEVAESVTSFSPQLSFPDGESLGEFIERVTKFLDRLDRHTPSQTMLIVSHNGPVRMLICRLLGIDMWHWKQIRIDNASLSIIETRPDRVVISLLNDISHLDGIHS